jgi:putative endonuclease
MHQYYVYILTNRTNSVLYVGITSNLVQRIYQHRLKLIDGFTKRYNVDRLVYFENTSDVRTAIAREKQLKGGSREKKLMLIRNANPTWKDLYPEISLQ